MNTLERDETVIRSPTETFEQFFRRVEPRLRRSLVAAYGPETGRDAACEALAFAWREWDRVRLMVHPVAYLYRVGQSRTRRLRRMPPLEHRAQRDDGYGGEPGLAAALRALTEKQRVAVVLVCGFGWSAPEVAEVLDVSATTVHTHVARGLEKLRVALGVRGDG